jgi:hypothetical protein
MSETPEWATRLSRPEDLERQRLIRMLNETVPLNLLCG